MTSALSIQSKSHSARVRGTHESPPVLHRRAASGQDVLQRKEGRCACGGGCPRCSKNKKLQTKLEVNEPGDIYEQEADRVADEVLTTSSNPAVSGVPPRIQRFSRQSTGRTDTAPAIVDRVLASSGRPLEPALQQDMGQRFGHDFSKVRVHTGATAEQSAEDMNASAYTIAHNVVFGAGRFAPDTREGRRLIAHELTHVVQQEGGSALRLFRQPDRAGSGLTLRTPEPRSLHGSLDAGDLGAGELVLEIKLIQQWLEAHPHHSESEHLRSELKRLQTAPTLGPGPFELRFYQAWDRAEQALREEVHKRDKASYGSSATRGLIKLDDLAVSPEAVWTYGVAAGLFLTREKRLVDEWSQKLASKTFAKRYDAAKYGHIFEQSREDHQDSDIWTRGVIYNLFLPSEKAAVLRIPLTGVARAASLTQRIKAVDPTSPEADNLANEVHDFTRDPGIVLLGPEVEKLLGPFGYTYGGGVDARYVAHDINTAFGKSLPPGQSRRGSKGSIQVRWDECMLNRDLGVNNLEAAAFDPACLSEEEFDKELIRRAEEFRKAYVACGHTRPSHLACQDDVADEYFPAGQARRDAIRRWANGLLEIYDEVLQGGFTSQMGFHFAYDVLKWSPERSLSFAGVASSLSMIGGASFERRAVLRSSPSNPFPLPTATSEMVGKPEPMPMPDAPVAQVAPKAPVKPAVEVKPPTAMSEVVRNPEPMPMHDAPVAQVAPKAPVKPAVEVKPPTAPPSDTLQLTLEQAQQRVARLSEKASQAETDYARRLRNTVRAKERRGEQPTQQETDLLATKRALQKARNDARANLNAIEKLRPRQPSEGVAKHGEAGLAQEPKYLDELRAQGLDAQLVPKNTLVIDAAIVGTPELHSVKSIVPSKGSEAAVRLAESSPGNLADRVSKRITNALMDRGSDKWSRLRNRWNNTMRATYADRFGYELPKNQDDISFVVEVRVVTAKAPSATAQQAVEAAVTASLKKKNVPPRFTWRISYVVDQ